LLSVLGLFGIIITLSIMKEHRVGGAFFIAILMLAFLTFLREFYKLWYPGIIKDVKMLALRKQMLELEQKNKKKELQAKNDKSLIAITSTTSLPEPSSITEDTTRDLRNK